MVVYFAFKVDDYGAPGRGGGYKPGTFSKTPERAPAEYIFDLVVAVAPAHKVPGHVRRLRYAKASTPFPTRPQPPKSEGQAVTNGHAEGITIVKGVYETLITDVRVIEA